MDRELSVEPRADGRTSFEENLNEQFAELGTGDSTFDNDSAVRCAFVSLLHCQKKSYSRDNRNHFQP